MDGEVGGVDVVCGHAGDEAGAQQRAECGKDEALVALLLDVVEEDVAQQIAGERGDAAAAKPGGLSRAGKADGQDDKAFGALGERSAASGARVAGISGWVSTSRRPEPAGSFHSGVAGRSGRGGRGAAGGPGLRPERAAGFPAADGREAGLRAAGRVVRIERNQRSWLIRWEFLADFACGFRGIGTASGASSHADLNTCLLIPE